MPTFSNPTDIAREAFRQLAARRIPPTPDNYHALYAEISGQPGATDGAFPAKEMRRLVDAIRQSAPGQARLERKLSEAIDNQDWDILQLALSEPFSLLESLQQLAWGKLISELFRQWNNKSDITPGKKREALERVLEGASANPRTLFSRLEGLSRAWGRGEAATDIPLTDPLDEQSPASSPERHTQAAAQASATPPLLPIEPPERAGKAADLLPEIREMLAYVLDSCIAPLLADQPALAKDAATLGKEIRNATALKQLEAIKGKLKRFTFRLSLAIEDQIELRASLLKLLRLLVENIEELLQDDQWLHGQIAMIREIVAQPLSQRALDDAETRMKEVIFKQSQLKLGLQEAQNALKHMLSGFVDHLASFADATSGYHDVIEKCARRISAADNINELEAVLEEVMRETREIQYNALRARDELRQKQRQVAEAEERILTLERELAETSHLIRHDQLTGVMNRRGLEETLTREIARAGRYELPICVSILDIDDFKQLNDSQGHTAGDEALIHLTRVIRDTLRPQDTVARYGGEEFLIIFPETGLAEAAAAMARLQRNLTRRFFLFQNQKLLITFSAGVAQLKSGEMRDSVINRADAAMYDAKKAGKNRVFTASASDQSA
ncbi:MAG: diguanylate cyclase [Betaproteobacteria bacterium]|nr:diguanylate cyclase [Betaproteobacteria bacterium]